MRYRLTALFALVAVLVFMPNVFAQRCRAHRTPEPASKLPFDPHDISGIWRNPGGFDPVIGTDRPPMTAWGKREVE